MQKDLLTIRSAESDFFKLRASSVAKALYFLTHCNYAR